MNRFVAAVLVLTVLTTAIVIPLCYYDSGPTVKVSQTQAHAQVEGSGLLVEWLIEHWQQFKFYIDILGVISAFAWAWGVISDLFGGFEGKPQFGPNSSTGCDAELFKLSKNKLVATLGADFVTLQKQGASLSNYYWYLFTQKAQDFCTDMEAKCGFSVGSYVCQQYLYDATNWVNPCSNFWAISRQNVLDATYPQCGVF